MLQQCNNSVTTPKNCIELRISRKKVARSGGLTEHMMCFLALSWLFAKPTGTFMIWKCPAMPPNGRKGAKRVHGNASPSTVYRAHVRAMYRHDAKGPILFGIELSCTNFESTDVASTVRAPTLRQTFSRFSGLPDPSFTFTQACCEKAAGEGGEEKGKDLQDDLTSAIFSHIGPYGDGSKPWYLVNPKIAGKWMFIPLKMVLIGIDPYPCHIQKLHQLFSPWKLGKNGMAACQQFEKMIWK